VFPEPLLTEEQAWAVEAYTAIANWRPGIVDMATGEWSGPPGYEWLATLAGEKLAALRQTARRGSSPVALLEEYGRSVAARFPPDYAKAPHWMLARLLAKVGQPFEDLLRAGHRAELEVLQHNSHGLTWR
jgi:hypothetical protein